MGQNEQDKVLAFDTLFTNNHIKMLKIIMSYFDSKLQKNLAIYIKFLELQYTISFFKESSSYLPTESPKEIDINGLCKEILPYCSKTERSKIEQISNMMNTLEMYKNLSQTMETMKEIFPEGFSGSENGGGLNPEMLSGILGSDASAMFEMLAAMKQDTP